MHSAFKKKPFRESDVPTLAVEALQRAYRTARASGYSVLEVVNDQLVKTEPNGRRIVLKPVKPGRVVKRGSKINLKK